MKNYKNCFIKVLIRFVVINALVILSVTDSIADEYKIKAALIYKLTKFVSWPENSVNYNATTLDICILGDDPFGQKIAGLTQRKTHGRQIRIKYYNLSSELPKSCQIVYVSKSKKAFLDQILAELHKRAILTISDLNDFANNGGIIELNYDGKSFRFIVNLSSAKQAKLNIAAPLLELSEIVK